MIRMPRVFLLILWRQAYQCSEYAMVDSYSIKKVREKWGQPEHVKMALT
jgi:hypothetical protein